MDKRRISDDHVQVQRRSLRLAAVIVVAAALLTAQQLGVFHVFGDPAQLRQTLIDLGPWGYAAFVGGYAAFQPFGIPGTIFVVAASLIWAWPVAFALSMIGTMAASVIGFSFARFIARDWVASRIPERFRKYDEALAQRAFGTVVLLRLIFWMPPLLHASFGISRVRFSTHFWGSLVGYLAPLFMLSFFGQRLFDWLRSLPTSAWIAAGAVVVVALVAARWLQQRRKRLAKAALASGV
jgi:uncharacterized membrane protein YdjX (TVP38/TMEM64 family)